MKCHWITAVVFFLWDHTLNLIYNKYIAVVSGTVLQVGRLRVRFQTLSFEFFQGHNPSGRTMALGVTQLLTEMSTKNISWRVKAAGTHGWQPYQLHMSDILKSRSLNLLEPSEHVLAFNGIDFLYSYLCLVYVFNPDSIYWYYIFSCNIICIVGSHRKTTTDTLKLTCNFFILVVYLSKTWWCYAKGKIFIVGFFAIICVTLVKWLHNSWLGDMTHSSRVVWRHSVLCPASLASVRVSVSLASVGLWVVSTGG